MCVELEFVLKKFPCLVGASKPKGDEVVQSIPPIVLQGIYSDNPRGLIEFQSLNGEASRVDDAVVLVVHGNSYLQARFIVTTVVFHGGDALVENIGVAVIITGFSPFQADSGLIELGGRPNDILHMGQKSLGPFNVG